MNVAKPVSDQISAAILILRGHRVLLDIDLARLYGVSTKALLQAVKRNPECFPEDFLFRLNNQEFAILRSQIVTSSWGGRRTIPCAFTEQGVAMLSSVLKSPRAIAVNIEIMRAFVRLRRLIASNKDLARRLDELEATTDARFRQVFEAIRQLMAPPDPPKRQIGFVVPQESGRTERSAK